MPTQGSVTVVATSAWKTPEFWISVVGILILIAQAPEVNALIPVAYQPLVLKLALAAATISNIVGGQLRNRPTLLNLWPSQTQAIAIDKIHITENETKDATSK